MRVRIRTEESEPGSITSWYKVNSTFIINELVTYNKTFEREGMIDVVTPSFKKAVSDGILINSPLWSVRAKQESVPLVVEGSGNCQGALNNYAIAEVIPPTYNIQGDLQTLIDNVLNEYSEESEVAQTKAWADIDVSEIQGAASLGELPETINWLVDRMKSLATLMKALRRKDVKTLSSIVKNFKKSDGYLDLWLEYRYAIRPLVSDILAALEAIGATLEKGTRFTARGKLVVDDGTVKEFKRLDYTSPNLASPIHGYMANVETTSLRTFRAGVLVEVDRSINTGLAIWGLDNPSEAIWELITLSFVADWFFNIGQVLSAAMLNPGLKPKISWVTEKVLYSRIIEAVYHVRDIPPECSQNIVLHRLKTPLGKLVETYNFKRRVPLAKQYSLPHLNVRLDAGKILDIFAIAKNML